MIIRNIFLMMIVAACAAQPALHAQEVPKKAESWGAWYTRNQVLIGAAVGTVVSIALRHDSANISDGLVASYLIATGSFAGKMNVL